MRTRENIRGQLTCCWCLCTWGKSGRNHSCTGRQAGPCQSGTRPRTPDIFQSRQASCTLLLGTQRKRGHRHVHLHPHHQTRSRGNTGSPTWHRWPQATQSLQGSFCSQSGRQHPGTYVRGIFRTRAPSAQARPVCIDLRPGSS